MEKIDFMRACREGGDALAAALRHMLNDYGGALRREAWRCLGEAEAAADLVQQTLIKAWQACASFRGESEIYPWLKTILRRGALDLLKERPTEPLQEADGSPRAEVERALQQLQPPPAPEALLARRQHADCWQRCAERFEREQPQAAAVLRWVVDDGLGATEIAELLGRSPGATREFISQCRKKARHYFADWYQLAAGEGA
ncbi:MAG: RNA polymerase sigma factor [Roseateles sp.]|uniref:RNA polymerase sigma factor n=1 Tax=Roseateles sp. TaxID=1971397 RepID=UPI0040369376